MKVIDLLNLVYEEKAPKKILYRYCEYEFDAYIEDYENKDGLLLFKYLFNNEDHVLDFEVEVIEEEKEIEDLDLGVVSPSGEYFLTSKNEKIQNKINELVREVNKLKNNK